MITIIKMRVEGFTLEQNRRYPIGSVQGVSSSKEADYAFGHTKPRYPVPALRDPYGYMEDCLWFRLWLQYGMDYKAMAWCLVNRRVVW